MKTVFLAMVLWFPEQSIMVVAPPPRIPLPSPCRLVSFARRILLATLASAVVFPAGVRAQPAVHVAATGGTFDATYYHLDLDLDFDVGRVAGRVLVEGRAANAPLDTLVLDLADGMHVIAVHTPEGRALPFTHAADLLRIDVPGAPADGHRIAVVVEYAGRPDASDDAFVFGRLSNGDAYAWSLSEPYGAREWWPCQDHPSDKADSVRVTLTVPEGMEVASNGLLRSVASEAGRTTFDWFSRYPIATYLVSVAAGRYVQTEQTYRRPDSLAARYGTLELPVLHYRYAARTDTLPAGWAEVTDALAVLEHWFGPYPFAAEKYGHAEFTWGGGMEHQTISSMGGTSVPLVVHELAHQWFGDMVTMRTWPHLWLNEGFATYAVALYWQSRADRYPARHASTMHGILEAARYAHGTLVVEDTLDVDNLFAHERVYDKGAAVLYMLHRLVGDATFRAILQSYAADPAVRYGTATTADFQRVAEAVAGRDFDTFFRQWVTEGSGVPAYRVRWSAAPGADGHHVRLRIEQTQEGTIFQMPVELTVETEAGTERFVVDNAARVQEVELEVGARPVAIHLDPDRRLLRVAWVDVARTDLPPPNAPHVFPNPVADQATIRYTLAADDPVRLVLYDVLGRERAVLLDAPLLPAGVLYEHTVDTSGLPSGTYFLRLIRHDGVVTRPLVVL